MIFNSKTHYKYENFSLFLILLSMQNLYAQNFNWDTALSKIYTPDREDAPMKVLLDKAPMFADPYNFNYPEFNTSNSDHFQQAITEINLASDNIFTNQTLFQNLAS